MAYQHKKRIKNHRVV